MNKGEVKDFICINFHVNTSTKIGEKESPNGDQYPVSTCSISQY